MKWNTFSHQHGNVNVCCACLAGPHVLNYQRLAQSTGFTQLHLLVYQAIYVTIAQSQVWYVIFNAETLPVPRLGQTWSSRPVIQPGFLTYQVDNTFTRGPTCIGESHFPPGRTEYQAGSWPFGLGFNTPAISLNWGCWVNWSGPVCSAGWRSAMNTPPTLTQMTGQTRRLHLSPASTPLPVPVPASPAVPPQVLCPVSPRVSETQFAWMFSTRET